MWEHVDEYAPLIDAWEVANRDDIFNPVGLKKLPFIANSDFHKPKHIHSWKTLLYCEKEAEAIKHCIRVNRDVSITLYRDHRFGLDEHQLDLPRWRTGRSWSSSRNPAAGQARLTGRSRSCIAIKMLWFIRRYPKISEQWTSIVGRYLILACGALVPAPLFSSS